MCHIVEKDKNVPKNKGDVREKSVDDSVDEAGAAAEAGGTSQDAPAPRGERNVPEEEAKDVDTAFATDEAVTGVLEGEEGAASGKDAATGGADTDGITPAEEHNGSALAEDPAAADAPVHDDVGSAAEARGDDAAVLTDDAHAVPLAEDTHASEQEDVYPDAPDAAKD